MAICTDPVRNQANIFAQDCAGFGFVYKAHPLVHIRICAGGCNAVNGRKDKQDMGFLFTRFLISATERSNWFAKLPAISKNCFYSDYI